MSSLPPCTYRVATEQPERFYCRHTRVMADDDLVSANVCGQCAFRLVPCANPRPEERSQERRAFPALLVQAWNAMTAVAEFVRDGCTTVDATEFQARLDICDTCVERVGDRCLQCGCHLTLKARGRAFQCPLGKWPDDIAKSRVEPTDPSTSQGAAGE
jgi:hypothetical protein